MFSWLGGILGTLGESISSVIFDTMLRWFYDTIYGAAAAFLAQIGSLGTEIFDLDWVQAFAGRPLWLRKTDTTHCNTTEINKRFSASEAKQHNAPCLCLPLAAARH